MMSAYTFIGRTQKLLQTEEESISVEDPDPGSGTFLTPRSWILDPGWVKNQDPGSGMNNPVNTISESLETIFWG
jgi:hypothetical protein